jgi:TorA maturation chaperone TorD
MYTLASTVFAAEPTREFLQTILELAVSQQERDDIAWFEAALFQQLSEYAEQDMDVLLRNIRTEYAELFIGPRPPLAPLFESLYIGYPSRMYTYVTREVRQFYETNGFTVVERNHVPDDHVAYELEFMARLCTQQAEATQREDFEAAAAFVDLQASFLKNHLSKWIPAFLERVEGAYCSAYYRAWCEWLDDFIADDVQSLKV